MDSVQTIANLTLTFNFDAGHVPSSCLKTRLLSPWRYQVNPLPFYQQSWRKEGWPYKLLGQAVRGLHLKNSRHANWDGKINSLTKIFFLAQGRKQDHHLQYPSSAKWEAIIAISNSQHICAPWPGHTDFRDAAAIFHYGVVMATTEVQIVMLVWWALQLNTNSNSSTTCAFITTEFDLFSEETLCQLRKGNHPVRTKDTGAQDSYALTSKHQVTICNKAARCDLKV